MIRSIRPIGALGSVLCCGLLSAALAAPGVFSIPLGAGSGDSSDGSIGTPLALTPESYLIAAEGGDGAFTTADDVVLLVTGVSGAPDIQPLSTPFLSDFSGRIVRLSATRAMVITAGSDGEIRTADDSVLLLDRLGSDNAVVPIVVGGHRNTDGYSPVPLTANSVVMPTCGEDMVINNADDTLALITNIGGGNDIDYLPAPFLESDRGRATPLTPTSFLIASNGPDADDNTADDAVFLFTGVGSTNARTDLAVPFQATLAPRQPVRVTATRAVMLGTGADHLLSTADDQLVLLDALGSANTIDFIPAPHAQDFGAGVPAPLSDTTIILSSEGPDSTRETADDQVLVITGLGTTNTVTPVTVGGLDEDRSARVVRLSPDRVAVATGGLTNPAVNGTDDAVAIISGVGGANVVTRVATPGVSFSAGSSVVAVSSTSFLVNHGGPDGAITAGGDDLISLETGAGAANLIESVPAAVEVTDDSGGIPQLLGKGRAAVLTTGANGEVGTGGDDVVRIVTNIPQTRGITVKKLGIAFKATQRTGPETFTVSGTYDTDDPTLLTGDDITVSVGNASQTIPAALFKLKKKGVLEYKDQKRQRGFISALILDSAKRKFSIKGKGDDLGGRTTDADYVPVAFDARGIYLADVVDATASNKGIKFP